MDPIELAYQTYLPTTTFPVLEGCINYMRINPFGGEKVRKIFTSGYLKNVTDPSFQCRNYIENKVIKTEKKCMGTYVGHLIKQSIASKWVQQRLCVFMISLNVFEIF